MVPPHNPEASQARILDAAEEAFAAHGYEGARVDAIAVSAQVNKRMLYHYFGDKASLYSAVVDRVARRVLAKMERAFHEAEVQDPPAALASLLEVFFDAAQSEPHYVRILGREAADDWRALSSAEHTQRSMVIAEVMDTLFRRVLPVLHRGVEQGVLRDDLDLSLVVILGTLLCRGYLSTVARLDGFHAVALESPAGLAWAKRHIVTLLLEGVRARPASRADGPPLSPVALT